MLGKFEGYAGVKAKEEKFVTLPQTTVSVGVVAGSL